MTGDAPLTTSGPNDADLDELWAAQQNDNEVRLTRETTHECWVGRKDKLLRIEQYLNDSLKAAFLEEASRVSEEAHPRTKELIAKRFQLRVVVTSSKGKIRRSGDLSSVLGEMDLSEVESIEMSNRPGTVLFEVPGPAVRLRLGVEGDEIGPRLLRGAPGVRWKVSGDDRQWVGGTFDWVATEIAKDVPWWAPARSRLASIVLGILFLVGGFGAVLAYGGPDLVGDEQQVPAFALIPLAVLYGLLVGPLMIRPLLSFLFPALELIEPGATPRGRQVLAVLVAAASLGLTAAGVVVGALAL